MKVPKYILYLVIDGEVTETTNLQEEYSLEEAIEISEDRLSLLKPSDELYYYWISIGKPFRDDEKLCCVPSVAVVTDNFTLTEQKQIDWVFHNHFY